MLKQAERAGQSPPSPREFKLPQQHLKRNEVFLETGLSEISKATSLAEPRTSMLSLGLDLEPWTRGVLDSGNSGI